MDKNDVIFWGIVVCCLVAMLLGITYMFMVRDIKYIEAGYTHTVLPGQCGTSWIKL